jgi:endoglucanase
VAVVVGLAATALEAATAWAREKGWKLFLGEFATTADPAYLDEARTLLRYMYANSDVWMAYAYWAGGLWWAEGRSSYAYSVEPANLDYPVDRPQMLMLREFTQPALI